MSRNRRPQANPHRSDRIERSDDQRIAERQLARADSRDVRSDAEAGDCSACGWITGRAECPMCGAAILGGVGA